MTDKTVVAIDVQAESFDAFLAKFSQYDEMLKEQSVIWRQINAAMGGGRSPSFNPSVGRTGTTANPFDDDKRWARVNKHTSQFSQFLRGSVRDSSQLAKNLAGIAVGLLKWSAIGTGIGAFGMTGLIGSVSDERKQAQGAGVTIGEQRAANNVYSRFYGSVDGMLNKLETLRHFGKWPVIRQATGIGDEEIKKLSNADLLQKILEYSHNRTDIDASDSDFNGGLRLQGLGLSELLTWEDFKRMKFAQDSEILDAGPKYAKAQETQNTEDKTAAEMQKVVQQWDAMTQTLKKEFVDRLVILTPLLVDASKYLESFMLQWLNNGEKEEEEWEKEHWTNGEPKWLIDSTKKKRIRDDRGILGGFAPGSEEEAQSRRDKLKGWLTKGGSDGYQGYLGDHDKSLSKKEMAKRLALPIKEHLENAWEGVKKWHDEIPKLPQGYLNPNYPDETPKLPSGYLTPNYQKEQPQSAPSNKKMNFNHNIKSNVNITVSNQTGSDINVIANAMRGA
jgi:hypothetical protein